MRICRFGDDRLGVVIGDEVHDVTDIQKEVRASEPYAAKADALINALPRIRGKLDTQALTVIGRTLGENIAGAEVYQEDVIRPMDNPIYAEGALAVHPLLDALIPNPELAARAVYWAATHRRREVWVGWPAVQAMLGTLVMPGVLDRLLGRRAVNGQLTAEPLPPGHQDNLWQPVPGASGVARVTVTVRRLGVPRCTAHPPVPLPPVTAPPPRRSGILAGPVSGPERLAAEYPAVEGLPGLPLLHRASGTTGAKRNVLKRFERVAVLKGRSQWKEGDRVTGLRKTRPPE